MRYFDYQSVARDAKIPDQALRKLVELIGKEFPNDQIMAELHALRACQAIHDGHVQIDDAIKQQAESSARVGK